MSQSLKTTTVKNISFNAIGKVVAFAFQSVANIILSRELAAADYGVVGFAMICVTFMKSFSGFGINSAAVHAKEFDEIAQHTAFTLRQILGVAAFLLTILLSGFAQLFIEHPAITSVIRLLALAILIDNFSLIPNILLVRKLKYSIISLAETGLTAASAITAIILALNGLKYWSIVFGYLAANIIFVIITNLAMPYKIKLKLDRNIAKQFLKYGSTVFLTGLLSFLVFNIDNFIVGAVAGVEQLGYYVIAFNWGSMVCSIMGAVVFGVLFPTFSRMQGEPERMKQGYLKVVQYTAMLSVLCNVGLFSVADNFLFSVLGKSTDKWLPSLVALRILCVYGILRSLIEPASSLFMAQGNTNIPFRAALLVSLMEFLLVYPAIKFGNIELVSVAVLFAYSIQLFLYLPALNKINNIKLRELTSLIWPAAVAGLAMFISSIILNSYLNLGILKLFVNILSLALVYILVYGLLTKWRIYIHIRDLLIVGNK